MIDIRNLSKVYSDSKTPIVALDNINIQIDKGEIYGIVGLSGAGKSSLVRCINRIEEPTSGEIYIDKINIMDLNQKDLRKTRKKISMIFQGFNLLNSKTVYENIAFPLKLDKLPKSEINARVNELLSWVELSDKANAYPSQLSGGQKQRVAIARALASKPDILLSDEATSALDPKTTNQILSMLKRINKEMNITIVVITHEMEVVKSRKWTIPNRGKACTGADHCLSPALPGPSGGSGCTAKESWSFAGAVGRAVGGGAVIRIQDRARRKLRGRNALR